MEEFLNKLFTSREVAHVLHLRAKGTGSYAKHIALQTYYDEIVDLIDDIAEIYQGQYGLIDYSKVIKIDNVDFKDEIKYFETLVNYVVKTRYKITNKAEHLNSNIDDIVSLLYKTIYKLKNLQ